jgi:hypothetical protein
LPAIYRAAVAKPCDSILPVTPHAQVLLPVPVRSRDKPRSYNYGWDLTMDDRMKHANALAPDQKHQVGAVSVGARLPAIYRAAVANPGDSILPVTPHAQVLLPVPGRSRASALLQ